MYMYIYSNIYMYVYAYIYIYTHLCMCMNIHIYINVYNFHTKFVCAAHSFFLPTFFGLLLLTCEKRPENRHEYNKRDQQKRAVHISVLLAAFFLGL